VRGAGRAAAARVAQDALHAMGEDRGGARLQQRPRAQRERGARLGRLAVGQAAVELVTAQEAGQAVAQAHAPHQHPVAWIVEQHDGHHGHMVAEPP
jgi:hypothetical protein